MQSNLRLNFAPFEALQTCHPAGARDPRTIVATPGKRGHYTRPDTKLGIGGEPSSIHFCKDVALDYVSCSPFREPIAWLSVEQSAIKALAISLMAELAGWSLLAA